MYDFFKNLFREYEPLKNAMYEDSYAIWINFVGGCLITITFLAIGLTSVLFSKRSTENSVAKKQRIVVGKLIGWSLIVCGLARMLDVLCIWHNFALLNGYIKNITGIIGMITLGYIPYVVRLIRRHSTIEEVKQTMIETNEKIEKLKEISTRILPINEK